MATREAQLVQAASKLFEADSARQPYAGDGPPGRRTLTAETLPGLRLHVRAIVRDGRDAFVGSQSLRALELDRRRALGVVVRDRKVVSRLQAVFESDWALTAAQKEEAEDVKAQNEAAKPA